MGVAMRVGARIGGASFISRSDSWLSLVARSRVLLARSDSAGFARDNRPASSSDSALGITEVDWWRDNLAVGTGSAGFFRASSASLSF